MKHRGFSLIELMIVVSVVGIAGGIALFSMSDQIADARAKSEALALLQEIRAEHRVAKEQMRGLRIKSVHGSLGPNKVIFQGTKSDDCEVAVGDQRVVEFQLARLDLNLPRACFNDRGEIDDDQSGGPSFTILPPPPSGASLLSGTPSGVEEEPAAIPVRMAITAGARPERTFTRGLRIDKSTINQETVIYRAIDGDTAVSEPVVPFAPADVNLPIKFGNP
jgi:prepilin-type N-terminal cleavage/methylation domain-containing protein